MSNLPVSPAGRRYGRNLPRPMEIHRMLSRRLPEGYPLFADFRERYCGAVKDQGNEGSCTGHAFSEITEWINRAYLKREPVLSPQYAYVRALMVQGDFPNDVGSDGETLCRVVISHGCCESLAFPYQAGNIVEPTLDQDANARKYGLGAFHGIENSTTTVSCLADPTPWPVAIGFEVSESFESNKVAQSGVMPIPRRGEKSLGGHEVAVTGGYDIGDVPTIRPKGCPPAVLVQNSWGTGWGIKGFFWMPLQILDEPKTDMKIVHSGPPWK